MPQTIYPGLRYPDADAALDFLKAAFGATENAIYRDDAGVIRHGQVIIGGGMVMIGTADDADADDDDAGAPGPGTKPSLSLYVVVPDPDAHHTTAVAAGADVIRELEDMDYGSREYGVRDPGGHVWSFGTYDPNAQA